MGDFNRRLYDSEGEASERVMLDQFVSNITTRLVLLRDDEMDGGIKHGLRQLLEFLQIEGCGLLQSLPGRNSWQISSAAFADGVPSGPAGTDIPVSLYPWSCDRLIRKGEPVCFSRCADLPAEATVDKESYARYGIESCLAIPIPGNKPVERVMVFHSTRERSWPEELIPRLRLLGEIFVTALDRKRSIQALRESEERLSLASTSAGIGLWELDMETGECWATPKALDIFGYAPGRSLTLEQILETVHPDDRGPIREAVTEAGRSGIEMSIDYRIIHDDNRIRWISSRGRLQAAGPGRPGRLAGIAIDITERKEHEAAAAEAHSLIFALIENTEDMIWSVDSERFGLLTFNTTLKDYFAKSVGLEIRPGMNPDDLTTGPFTPSFAGKWRQLYRRALDEGPFTEEYTVSAGERILLLSLSPLKRDGEVFGISVFGKDITERHRMDETIRKAAEEWQSTFNSIHEPVVLLDSRRRIIRANRRALQLSGLPEDKVLGMPCHTVICGSRGLNPSCPVPAMLSTKRHEEAEFYDEERDTWFHVSADPIVDGNGEITRIVHIMENITDRKKAEACDFAALKESFRFERILRMGELSASLAHELSQPLTSILSNARAAVRFLESGRLDTGELKEILTDIAQDDKRAGAILRSLRSMIKAEEGETEMTTIADLLEEVVSLFNGEAIMRNIEVKMDIEASLPLLRVNKVQVQQVLINLMMNGAEAMETEGWGRQIVIGACRHRGFVEVSVRDSGKGIRESEMRRLFEPFFTTKARGLGMGLSLSRSIMENHGGHIWADNNPDKGATFHFDLPVFPE